MQRMPRQRVLLAVASIVFSLAWASSREIRVPADSFEESYEYEYYDYENYSYHNSAFDDNNTITVEAYVGDNVTLVVREPPCSVLVWFFGVNSTHNDIMVVHQNNSHQEWSDVNANHPRHTHSPSHPHNQNAHHKRHGKGQKFHSSNSSLTITNLQVTDSGEFTADCYINGNTTVTRYLLIVRDLEPKITVLSKYITREWCNISVACNATGHKRMHMVYENYSETARSSSDNSLSVNLYFERPATGNVTCLVEGSEYNRSDILSVDDVCLETRAHSKVTWPVVAAALTFVLLLFLLGFLLFRPPREEGAGDPEQCDLQWDEQYDDMNMLLMS